MKLKRPALRYFGGKWRLAPWIIEHMPEHYGYIEPFGGGASVLLRKPRSHVEIYNDLDGSIVNFFRVLQDPASAAELIRKIHLTPFAREEFDLAQDDTDDPVEMARRIAITSYMSFGSTGIFKNSTGFRPGWREWKTPAHDWSDYPYHLQPLIDRFQGVVIENMPANYIFDRYDRPEALFYVDPPYPKDARDGRNRDVYNCEMSDQDHIDLAAQLKQLQGTVMLSGYHCDLYDDLFSDWQHIEKDHYSANSYGRTDRVEVLWLSPNYKPKQKRLL